MAEVLIGNIEGSYLLGNIPDQTNGEAYLQTLWIAPEDRRKGIATSFFLEFLAVAMLHDMHGISTVLAPYKREDKGKSERFLRKHKFEYQRKLGKGDFYYRRLK